MKPRIIAIGQLPPPVTGFAAANSYIFEALAKFGLLQASFQIGGSGASSKILKAALRGSRTLSSAFGLVKGRLAGAKVLYMPCDGGKGLLINIGLACIARILGYQLFIHHHSFAYIHRRSRLMERLISYSPRGASHIFLCETMRDDFCNVYGAEWSAARAEALVLPNAFLIGSGEQAESRCEGRADDAGFTIGHLSNLTREKGALDFMDLFERLRVSGRPVRAIIAGPCGDPVIRERISELKALYGNNFEWTGPLYGRDKDAFYRNIDVFVFPSRYLNEAQPLVLLEALAAGSALLTTRRGCMSCDHEKGPGAVFDEASFVEEAVSWFDDSFDANSRDIMRSEARLRFAAVKTDADAAFRFFVNKMVERTRYPMTASA